MEPITAGKKPPTVKPGVRYPTKPRAIAFTTNRNNPRVKIVRGNVKITSKGFTMALTKPRTAAPTKAVGAPAIAKPGTMMAVRKREAAVANQVIKN